MSVESVVVVDVHDVMVTSIGVAVVVVAVVVVVGVVVVVVGVVDEDDVFPHLSFHRLELVRVFCREAPSGQTLQVRRFGN